MTTHRDYSYKDFLECKHLGNGDGDAGHVGWGAAMPGHGDYTMGYGDGSGLFGEGEGRGDGECCGDDYGCGDRMTADHQGMGRGAGNVMGSRILERLRSQ